MFAEKKAVIFAQKRQYEEGERQDATRVAPTKSGIQRKRDEA
jgi:hypothetical protein